MRLRCPSYKVTDGSVSKGKDSLRAGKSLRKQELRKAMAVTIAPRYMSFGLSAKFFRRPFV